MKRTLLALLVAAAACSPADRGRGEASVRDSAGIRVVVQQAPRFAGESAWRVSDAPVVEIGQQEGDSTLLLHRVEATTRTDDGRIVIANANLPLLRWYAADGTYVQGTGRPGGGPGEFAAEGGMITALWPMQDSVGTWEHSARRLQVFGPDAQVARAVTLELPSDMPPGSYPQIFGMTGDGGFVGVLLAQPSADAPVGSVIRDSLTFVRYDSTGAYRGAILRAPGYVWYVLEMQRGDQSFRTLGRPPFSPSPLAAAHDDGLYYSSADRWEIRDFDVNGRLRTLIRREEPRRELTEELVDRSKELTMRGAPADPATRREWERTVEEAPYPDSIPALRRMRVDRDGMLWVQAYDAPGDTALVWSVFDAQGQWLSDVQLPLELELHEIGTDYVLGVVRDELGVERVRMLSLDRGGVP